MSLSVYQINHVHRVYKNQLRFGKSLGRSPEHESAPDRVEISPEAKRRILDDKTEFDKTSGITNDNSRGRAGQQRSTAGTVDNESMPNSTKG